MKLLKVPFALSLATLAACATTAQKPEPQKINYTMNDIIYISDYETAAQKSKAKVKMGKPYQVKEEWYEPVQEPSYSKEGLASWYGPGFEGGRTANGEVFNSNALTAAHPTLPIPSIVQVENLDNGNMVNVRINDRGPFHSNRIIDVSKGAARELGMLQNGTANVRVTLLPDETLEFLQVARN